jgi:hypothetical protein
MDFGTDYNEFELECLEDAPTKKAVEVIEKICLFEDCCVALEGGKRGNFCSSECRHEHNRRLELKRERNRGQLS